MKIVFFGAGNMASAIFTGMIEKGVVKPDDIYITSKSNRVAAMEFKEELGVKVSYDDAELCRDADYIILASKPQNFSDVAKRLRPYLEKKTKLVSVMAGIHIAAIQEETGMENPVARIMPNTNAMVQYSVNGIAFSDDFSDRDELIELMASFGKNVVVGEEGMDNITAATGSGPAFLYYIYEMYAKSLEELGFSKEDADKLTRNLVIGTGKTLAERPESFEKLRTDITSKAGTTEAGLNTLSDSTIQEIIFATLGSARDRSKKLSER
ncbi:Pyrroline-5-carboxylate reductase [Jeotgalicoccus saudimassiliensis]|uniref:Pyrroline-5-carboxylate reductase n=1 Tax=Jeotgalicoccus saudimassiliensis TaxID=1461582 RepID=A0A078M7A9_9STAP|nr:pyrroline-5-carboxylate reductase [Jeotgalicoccus saudimassiliensis]CEA01237.1 Pyrroline-5-carboxylate reductase [Jeotgalicoccus saudimassiliensis]